MEDVHTDGLSVVLIITLPGRMVGHHLLICTGTHLPCCLLRHCTQIVQEALKCRGRRTWVRLLRGEMRRRRALDGTALRVAQHQDEAALQRARGELQAAHHGALGMRAGVARIPQDEDVTGHGVEDSPQSSTVRRNTSSPAQNRLKPTLPTPRSPSKACSPSCSKGARESAQPMMAV